MIYITRKARFSAAHRLYNPAFSDQRNQAVFDKCNNPNGHGHNYELVVTVRGTPDPETGYVMDLKRLAEIIDELIIDRVDHKHLNFDVDFLEGVIPTAENLVVMFWGVLRPHIQRYGCELHALRLYESDNNYADYFGDPIDVPRYAAKTAEATK